MVTMSALDRLLPIWAVFPGFIALVMFAVVLGNRIGRSRAAESIPEGPVGSVVGSMLGLLAFMLAFTFGIASSRFDARKQLLLDDVNAISAAVHRSELLPEPHRSESLALLRRYVDLRVEVAGDPTSIRAATVETATLQRRLWSHAVTLAKADMNSDIGALYVEALDDLAAVHTSRMTVALQYRIPVPIWYVLILLTVMCMGGVGYQFGIAGRSSVMLELWLAIAFAAVVTVIAQLDRPTSGMLRVSQQPMLDLQARLEAPPTTETATPVAPDSTGHRGR
jgi:hypothetical protein